MSPPVVRPKEASMSFEKGVEEGSRDQQRQREKRGQRCSFIPGRSDPRKNLRLSRVGRPCPAPPSLPPSVPTLFCETLGGGNVRGGTETCDSKLYLLGLMAWPVAATAIDASILRPQGADDEGAVCLELVPEWSEGRHDFRAPEGSKSPPAPILPEETI